MSAQVAKVNRLTGEIVYTGYLFPSTQESEASAECAWKNMDNHDPEFGFIVVRPDTTVDEIRDRITYYTKHNTLGFVSNFDSIKLGES